MRILKYELPQAHQINISDPVVRVLSAKNQRNNIEVWCLVDDENVSYHRTLELSAIGTGWDVEEDWFSEHFFVDTVIVEPWVWHIWGRYIED